MLKKIKNYLSTTTSDSRLSNLASFVANAELFKALDLSDLVQAKKPEKALCAERKLPLPKAPVIFLKPTSSYIIQGQEIELPTAFAVNEEVELGVIIGQKCKNIKPSQVLDHVAGYCLALDLTATNFLDEAKTKGLPWSLGKGFDTACPVSNFIPKSSIPNPDNVHLWCKVNGEMKQDANTSDMIFSVGDLISYISQYMTLEPYDLILTGSSKGVCQIKPGDRIEAGLERLANFSFIVKSL